MDSARALKYVDLWWKILGVYPVAKYKTQQVLHLFLITITTNLWSFGLFNAKLLSIEDIRNLLRNLPMNIVLFISAVKFCIIFLMRLRLRQVNVLLKRLDQRVTMPSHIRFLTNMIKFGQILTLAVTASYMSVNITAAANALFSHRTKLMFETWLPYDWTASAMNYYFSLAFQSYTQIILCIQGVATDVSPIIYLIILTAHFRLLMIRIENLQKDLAKSDDESVQELLKCIEDHRTVMSIFNILQRTISHTIFIQFVATALVLALLLLQFLIYSPNFTESANIFVFAVAVLLQIFPSCYYANKFMITTDQLVTSLYSMDWYNQSQKFKEILIIFMTMTQKEQMIFAGRIIPVNLATFVSIIKFSYSIITIGQRVVHEN